MATPKGRRTMTKLLTKPQSGQDEVARSGKRGANREAAPVASPARDGGATHASAVHPSASSVRHDASHAARNDTRNQAMRPTLAGAYAAQASYQAYTSSAPGSGRWAHAHVAPSSLALSSSPTAPTTTPPPILPTAPTRLEASMTTVGDLARRYPSVAAFVQAGLPAPFEPAPAAMTKQPKSAPTAKHAHAASHVGKPAAGVRQRFAELRAALAEGWEIVQPIFARPLWSVADDSATAFNFVLSRAQATRLVTVPEGRTVSRFIREQALVVDYRR